MKEIYEYDLTQINDEVLETDDLYLARTVTTELNALLNKAGSEVTIVIGGFNRLEKTKRCVESVLKYTKNINYDLILIDNGSSDGTFEYFKTVEHDKIRIIRFNKNFGFRVATDYLDLKFFSKYYVCLANDMIVTENWLDNMLKIAKSDPKIGMVNPMTSNVSNNQMYNLEFKDYDEMQQKAAQFNISDPTKWQERLRLVTLGTLYTKECIYAVGWPLADCGFTHDFADDDETFRVRRAGYKAILAGDTWIHHDHNVFKLEDKDPVAFRHSLQTGRKNFSDKYFGIDAWDDVGNYVFPFIGEHILMPPDIEGVKILGIDVKCGTPVLDIKNTIRKYNIFDPEVSAFTTDSKYHIDLKTICCGEVVCDRIEYLNDSFEKDSFDYIIIDKCINKYSEPIKVLKNAYSLLKSGGQLFFKLKNTYNIFTQLELMGYNMSNNNNVIHFKFEDFYQTLLNLGIKAELIYTEIAEVDEEISNYVVSLINYARNNECSEKILFNKLMTDKYWLKIIK